MENQRKKGQDTLSFAKIERRKSPSPLTNIKSAVEQKNFGLNDGFFKQLVESLEDYCVFTTDIEG